MRSENQKLQEFLPYHTKKDRSTFFGDFFVSVGSFFWLRSLFFGRAEILVISGLRFGRNQGPHKFILNLTDL